MASDQSTTIPDAPTWQPIPDWPRYEASSAGDIRRAVDGTNSRAGHILKHSIAKSGYASVSMCDGRRRKTQLVHRLVAATFFGPAEGRWVHHKDTCRTHNHVDNLEYTTPQGNVDHMVAADRQARGDRMTYERRPRGSRHGMAKLTEDAVREIRALITQGVRSGIIAAQFGVSRDTIKLIRRGVFWQHVKEAHQAALPERT